MKSEMPSQEEHDEVVWYVLKRPIVRPNTSCKKAALCIALFLSANVLMTTLLYYLFRWLGISSFLPDAVYEFYTIHHTAFIILLTLFQFVIGGIIALKPAIIGAIHLYQRYAPEGIRRRCLFKPTCSEYAILAIQKYGLIKGLIKTYIRLFKKCKGHIYRIDYP